MKLNIGAKLGMGFGVILVLMATSTTLSYFKIKEIMHNQDRILSVRVTTLRLVAN
jgi:hypothetical protein